MNFRTRLPLERNAFPSPLFILVMLGFVAVPFGSGQGAPDPEILAAERMREAAQRPDGIHVLDGSYVLDHGDLFVNITNHGLIGSQYTETLPYSNAPSGQWPGGSGREYLWGAGLWIGGISGGQIAVTTGQPERELRPGQSIFETIYEARDHRQVRPSFDGRIAGRRPPWSGADDDGDGQMDEDPLNGVDDDGDGLIDEDFGQIGTQMFTCTMHDDGGLVQELYPDHEPMNLKIVQRAAVYEDPELADVVVLDFEITNKGPRDIEDLYLGTYVDCDIQRRAHGASHPDDLAGFFRGAVRGSDGSFHRLEIGWMRDANPVDPLPGVFGAILLGHDTDPLEYFAPHLVGVKSFQIFGTNALVIQDGEPRTDRERYGQMISRQSDRDRADDEPGDLKFLLSSGPFGHVARGRQLGYRIALVVGNGMDGMLRTALRVSELHRGRYFDADRNPLTGGGGNRETLVCLGDYPNYTDGSDPIYDYRSAFMDEACVGPDPVFGGTVISPGSLFVAEDGRRCLYVNADNCEECFRRHGRECTIENGLFWESTPQSYPTPDTGGERYVPWVSADAVPPMPPNMRVVAGDNFVEIFWDDVSEYDRDPVTGKLDFESYRLWRVANWIRPDGASNASGPEAVLWNLIAEYDVINSIAAGVGHGAEEQNLGRNTGFEGVRYEPACLTDARYEGLAAATQVLVDEDIENRLVRRPSVRVPAGTVAPGMEPFLPWETEPAVLDTFFAVAGRASAPPPHRIRAKRSVNYYHFRDTEVRNGFQTFYSVVASDHRLDWVGIELVPAGYGVQGEPGNNQHAVTPVPAAQTASERATLGTNIYVYPNPATRAALAEFQGQPPSAENPTGVSVVFNNLPASGNTITVYTASGDLVATIDHDGRREGGLASWNLMSRNGQEVVSGVYLYAVVSDDALFAPFRGRFVVIR